MTSLGFTNPWFLLGAGAVGLPILIHYLTRARPRRIKFPPLQFLLEACAGQQSLHRLRTWIVLAVRCLAVLALVLLFSRPFLRAADPLAASRKTKRVVLVVDASFSMRAVVNGVPLFARAQAEAADLLRSFGGDTQAAVILMGAKPHAILPALSPNLPVLHRELVQTKPTFEAANPAAALSLAKRILGEGGAVYVFSDFQRSNWNVSALDELRGLPCYLRPVVERGIDNAAITRLQLAPAEPLAGEPVELTCTVLNSSPQQRQETVRLELEGVTQEKGVVVPPFASRDVTFAFTLSGIGSFPGKIALGIDDLAEDNTRYFVARVQKGLQVLLVSDTDANDRRSAAFFVSKALVPSEQVVSGLKIVRRHGQETDRGILETADAFLLVNPVALSGEAAEIIARRVGDGAQLVCFLDGPTAPNVLAALLSASKGRLSPPFQLLRMAASETPGGEPFSVANLTGKPLALFANPEEGEIATLRFRRHYQSLVADDRKDELLLAFPDGSAALAMVSVGKGAVVFANLPLAPDASNLAGSPLFPAMMHELLRALRRTSEGRDTAPGEPWFVDVPGVGADESALKILSPDGKSVEARVVASGRTVRLALPEAAQPGHFLVRQGEQLLGAGVVNVDSRESDTRPIAQSELVAGHDQGARNVAFVGPDQLQRATEETRPLWPWFAAAAAALLGTEMLLLALWRQRRVAAAIVPNAGPPASRRDGGPHNEEALAMKEAA